MNKLSKIVCLVVLLYNIAVLYCMDIVEVIRSGDSSRVRKILGANPEVINKLDANGYTLFDLAVREGRRDIVSMLIKAGAGISQQSASGSIPLVLAVIYGHLDIVKQLIAAGADINWQGAPGWHTPLSSAVVYGRLDIVKELIAAGVIVDQRNPNGVTALHMHMVTQRVSPVMVSTLLAAGADPSIRNSAGRNALEESMYRGYAAIIIQNIRDEMARRRERSREVGQVFAMATDHRFGSRSPIGLLPQYLLSDIVRLVLSAEHAH